MDLNVLCFALLGFLMLGYFILEGFDYGIGMLLAAIGKNELERQVLINTIAPLRDGHEVWVIAAGAVLLASFPMVYATVFSGLYLLLVLLLLALIVRNLAIEMRSGSDSKIWRRVCDWGIFAGSIAPAFLWGVVIASLAKGLPIDAAKEFSGSVMAALNLYTLVSGSMFTLLFVVHGAAYLTQRVERNLAQRAAKAGLKVYNYAIAAAIGFAGLTCSALPAGNNLTAGVVAGGLVLLLLAGRRLLSRNEYLPAFCVGILAIAAATGTVAAALFPRLAISTLNPAFSLDIYNSAASPAALTIISRLMLVILPVLAAGQIWKSYRFWRRLSTEDLAVKQSRQELAVRNKALRKLLAIAGLLEDAMAKVSYSLQEGNGQIIHRLKPGSKALLCGKPRKLVRRPGKKQASEK